MSSFERMSIGVFAQRSGLTASALRFYADSGLLLPAEVDPVSGYRYYEPGQLERAVGLRRLREIGMPLGLAETILDAEPVDAARLIDEHVAKIVEDAATVRRKAADVKAALGGPPGLPIATVLGPVFAAAVEQVLAATVREPAMPVLNGLRIEASPDALSLTATDRYRLSTRTLVPSESCTATWAATVDGDDLRTALTDIRRSAAVRIEATADGIRLRTRQHGDHFCGLLPEPFPDYRAMLAALPEPSTRVTVAKDSLLRALECAGGEAIQLLAAPGENLTVEPAAREESGSPASPAESRTNELAAPALASSPAELAAVITGPELTITFELTTFYPAVSTAIGPEVMLDLRGPDHPVTIRSADRGDLTTLAMPIAGEAR